MSTTDFSKFRDSGELSDLVVVVDDHEFKLHKFPLFIKSDFFRALARSNVVEKDKVQLEDFPGGRETFELVANYCYNIRIEVNEKNVCKLRCAAEFLQMNTPGNLADATDRLLIDILTTAKVDRNVAGIASLLLQCKELGAISEQAKIVDKCINAIIDCWLFSTKFIKPHSLLESWTDDFEIDRHLFQIPFAWFVLLFTSARDKNVRPSILADLVQSYVTYVINKKSGKTEDDEDKNKKSADKDKDENETEEEILAKDADNGTPVDGEEANVKGKDTKEKKDETDEEEKGGEEEEEVNRKQSSEELEQNKEYKENVEDEEEKSEVKPTVQTALAALEQLLSDDQVVKDLEIAVIVDTLLGELPDNVVFADYLSPRWTLKVLKVAEANECKSTGQLRKLVSRVVHRLSPDELAQLSPDLMCEIVTVSSKDDDEEQNAQQKQLTCNLVDSYLSELAIRDELNVDTFNQMVDVVPSEFRFSHDTLYQVMEALIKSERVKLTEEQKESVMESIDFSRLSETTLQRAYDSELIPAHHITKAALALCKTLRKDLDEALSVIASQEKQIDKYNFRRYRYNSGSNVEASGPGSSLQKSALPLKSKFSRDLESLPSPRHLYLPSSVPVRRSYAASIPTYASEKELKLALESLEDVPDYHFKETPHDKYSFRSSSLGYGSYLDEHDTVFDTASDYSLPRSRYVYRGYRDPWPFRY